MTQDHEAGVLRLAGPEELIDLLNLVRLPEEMVLHSFERQRMILEKAAELGIPALTGVRFARDRKEFNGIFANLTIIDLPDSMREVEARWALAQVLEAERESRFEPGKIRARRRALTS